MKYLRFCAIVAFIASSCTFSEPRLRPEPITSYATPNAPSQYLALGVTTANTASGSGQTSLAQTTGETAANIQLPQVQYDCAEYQSNWNFLAKIMNFFTASGSLSDNCIYVRARPSSIVMVYDNDIDPKDSFIPTLAEQQHDLIYHSNYNCNNFLPKVFATRANASFGKSFFNTLISGVNTVITPAVGIPTLIPTALSASNTVVSGTVADYVDAYVENQSLQDLEKAILAKRQILRLEMKARICATRKSQLLLEREKKGTTVAPAARPSSPAAIGGSVTTKTSAAGEYSCSLPADGNYAGYNPKRYWDMQEAVDDVMTYDRICSLEGGLAELAQATAEKQSTAQKVGADIGSPAPTPPQAESTSAQQAVSTPTPTPTATPTSPPGGHRHRAGAAATP